MKTAKYWVQQPPTIISSSDPQSRAYVVVIGLALGAFLVAAGGAMGYFAYFDDSQSTSLATAFYIPTKIIGPVLLGSGAIMMLCSCLVCACCGFPRAGSL